MITYVSTRGGEERLNAAQAVIRGLSGNKGLFVPEVFPQLPVSIEEMQGMKYQDVAKIVIGTFFDDYTEEEIASCVERAYDSKFEAEDVVPVVEAGDACFLELYHGRTAAFKDMALSILPHLLKTAVKKEGEDAKICILTATSGDTGKAALEGFADVEGTEIVVFFPEIGVSEVQRRQMTTQEGKNTDVFAIRGNFDDAQTGVKKIFNDEEMAACLAAKGVKLSSANSINIGRLVPQVAYYIYGYLKMVEMGKIAMGEKINVVVPTGNFGNILASYYACKLGLPVNRFLCASNENKVLTDFINEGVYDTRREFYVTNSPSMDILISSNLERLLYELSGGDAAEIRRLMAALDSEKHYEVSGKIREGLAAFYGGFADVADTDAAIGRMYRENHYLLDTHTAVAYKVYEDYREKTGDTTPALIASTASPYKFAKSVATSIGLPEEKDDFAYVEALEKATGVPVEKGLRGIDKKPILHDRVIDACDMAAEVEAVL